MLGCLSIYASLSVFLRETRRYMCQIFLSFTPDWQRGYGIHDERQITYKVQSLPISLTTHVQTYRIAEGPWEVL